MILADAGKSLQAGRFASSKEAMAIIIGQVDWNRQSSGIRAMAWWLSIESEATQGEQLAESMVFKSLLFNGESLAGVNGIGRHLRTSHPARIGVNCYLSAPAAIVWLVSNLVWPVPDGPESGRSNCWQDYNDQQDQQEMAAPAQSSHSAGWRLAIKVPGCQGQAPGLREPTPVSAG